MDIFQIIIQCNECKETVIGVLRLKLSRINYVNILFVILCVSRSDILNEYKQSREEEEEKKDCAQDNVTLAHRLWIKAIQRKRDVKWESKQQKQKKVNKTLKCTQSSSFSYRYGI